MNRSYTKIRKIQEANMNLEQRRVLYEQSSQNDYQDIANYLYKSMKGLSSSEDSDNIKSVIINRVKNKNDWEGVKKAFGVRDGENLDQWLSGELRINTNDIMNIINQNDSNFNKQDSMYNPGSKIRLITNRQFIIARSNQYSSMMKGKEELELDIEGATVVRREKDGIIVKVPRLYYYTVGERKRGEYPKQETLTNVCLKIQFKDIIEWRNDTLQIRWFSNYVREKVVPC